MVYPSPVLPKLRSPDVDPRLRMDTEHVAWFGSVYTLGAAAGGLGAMLLNDMIGRKLSIMMSAVPSTIGWAQFFCLPLLFFDEHLFKSKHVFCLAAITYRDTLLLPHI